MELPSTLFSPSSKNEKIHLQKKIVIFYEIELVGSNIKKFQETETPKKFLILQETKTPKKFLIFSQKKAARKWKPPKKFFISHETEPLKTFLSFRNWIFLDLYFRK